MQYSRFLPGLVAGAAFFCGWHLALGYLAGPAVAEKLGSSPLVIPLIVMVLAAIGLAVWLMLRRHNHQGAAETAEQLLTWTEAACPACLAVGIVQQMTAVDIRRA